MKLLDKIGAWIDRPGGYASSCRFLMLVIPAAFIAFGVLFVGLCMLVQLAVTFNNYLTAHYGDMALGALLGLVTFSVIFYGGIIHPILKGWFSNETDF